MQEKIKKNIQNSIELKHLLLENNDILNSIEVIVKVCVDFMIFLLCKEFAPEHSEGHKF